MTIGKWGFFSVPHVLSRTNPLTHDNNTCCRVFVTTCYNDLGPSRPGIEPQSTDVKNEKELLFEENMHGDGIPLTFSLFQNWG